MEQRTYHIRRTIDIVVSAPMNELKDDTEQWITSNFVPSGTIKDAESDHIIKDIRLVRNDDDQDSFVVVSWPDSQRLCDFEDYTDNCTFIMGDNLECCSYLVNKEWYSRLLNGELRRIEELYEEAV